MNFARRVALVAAVALGLSACTEVTQEPMPEQLQFATFASPNIPTPNDLALAAVPTLPASAQKELLQQFVNGGGWPYDQEVSINIPFSARRWDGAAYVADTAPTLDAASVTTSTVVLYQLDPGGAAPTPVPYQAITTNPGVLTLRKPADANGRRWTPGARYFVAIRGGGSGVKAGGKAFSADSAVALAIPNRDLTKPENQPLGEIPDSSGNGSNADEIQSLEGVRNQLWNVTAWSSQPCVTGTAQPLCWKPSAVGAGPAHVLPFPVTELVSFTAFTVASSGATNPLVLIDAGSGVAPLPNDLLRSDADGTVILNPSFGAAAGGISTLDGFSTTAMMLAATSMPIKANTVKGGNLFLYRIANGAATLVPEFRQLAGPPATGNPATAGYIAQPPPIVDTTCGITGGCSVAIGLQPATKVPAGPGVNFYMPPLAQNATYAVVITNRVTGLADQPLVKPTVAKILLDIPTAYPFYLPDNPNTAGVTDPISLLSGVSVDTARTLQQMRADLEVVWPALPGGAAEKANVVTAYTFKTQSIVSTALSLAAAPYGIEQAAATPVFAVTGQTNITAAFPALPGVASIWQITYRSFDGIDKTTGAFRPTLPAELNPAAWTPTAKPTPLTDPNLVELTAYVTVPTTIAGACPAGYPGGTTCAPIAVVGHGLNGNKSTLIAMAAELAGRGYIGMATDFPLHGARNWCNAGSQCVVPGTGADGTCTPFPGGAGQGDALPPGQCTDGSTPKTADSRYFVSANFFRIRDAFRQNLLDQSAMILATARPLPATPLAAILPAGSFADPSKVHYLGVSLGSISGTSVVATNPRIKRATFDVGGGTFADIAINAPAFKDQLEPLFASLIPGFSWEAVTPGDPAFSPAIASSFLQLVNVAKWILDPGDPINFAVHVQTAPLPDLLANPNGTVAQAPKPAYGQISAGDTVVPNNQNDLLYSLMGATTTRYDSDRVAGVDGSGVAYAANSVPHGIIGVLPGGTSPAEYVAAGAQVRADATNWLIEVASPATRTFDLTP